MQCEKYLVEIQRYLDEDLNEQEKQELFAHLEECADCKREFEEYQALHQQLVELPKVELDISCIDDILNKIDIIDDTEEITQLPTEPDNKIKVLYNQYRKYITPALAAAAILLALFMGKGLFLGEKMADEIQNDMLALEAYPSHGDMENEFSLDDKGVMEFSVQRAQDFAQAPMESFGVDRSLLEEKPHITEDVRKAPTDVQRWVERSKGIFAGQSFVYNGKTYIYVSLGMKRTAGYEVSIEQVYYYDEQLYVYTRVTEPISTNRQNATAYYPQVLIVVEGEHKKVSFNEWQGAEIVSWIPEIYGIESIPEFYHQSSDTIKVYSPKPDITLVDSIMIQGIARTFDGSVFYRMVTEEKEEIASGFLFATRAAPDWGHFEQEIFIDLPRTMKLVRASIEIYEVSLRDGGQIGTVTIPITIRASNEDRAQDLMNKHWVSYMIKDIDVNSQQLQVEQLLTDARDIQAPTTLSIRGVPIVRDISQEKANTISQRATINDLKLNQEIGALVSSDGKVKQIFLFDY